MGSRNKKLVLIDTAGMSQRDVRLANQFTTLNVDGYDVRTVLALSAGADRGCLAEAMNVFKAAKPEALIVTKLDEAVGARRRAVAGDQARSAPRLSLRRPTRAGGPALRGAETVLAAAQRAEAVGECADARPTSTSSRNASVTWGLPPMRDLKLDQAAGLRRLGARRNAKVIAITGGKGGVGKTLTAVNLGAALAGLGRSTMLLDADLGMANVDVLLGLRARLNLEHVVNGECGLEDVILNAPVGSARSFPRARAASTWRRSAVLSMPV